MPRPPFAEMLVERRRQLGLSIAQASQVLRLKEQVLVAFEDGDFERIPKSGYAQGMLSSYARYLGLNSRDVVRQFSRDLDEYLINHPGIDQDAESYGGGTGDVTRRQVGTFGTTPYVGSRGLLPTSGGLAGDMGAFATTSQPHSRMDTGSMSTSGYEGSQNQRYGMSWDSGYETPERRYTSRPPATGRAGQGGRGTSRYGVEQGGAYGERPRGGYDPRDERYGRDQVTTRRVSSSQYKDDLRYDDGASPYEAASTSTGRRSSRNIARVSRLTSGNGRGQQRRRPNGASSHSRQGRRRPQNNRPSGISGIVSDILASGNYLPIIIAVVLTVILFVIIVFSVNSCGAKRSGVDGSTVPVAQTETSGAEASSAATATAPTTSTTSATATTGTQNGSATTGTSADATASTTDTGTSAKTTTATGSGTTPSAKETKVVVSVEAGAVSWIDVQCDGESMVADTITGPWSETYDVHEAIVIQASNTTAVTVTENGTRRQLDAKEASGTGSITIQGTPKEDTKKTSSKSTDEDEAEDEDTSEDEEKSSSSSSSKKDKKDKEKNSDSKSSGFEPSDDDEFLYTYGGYDIYYSESEDLYYFYDEAGLVHNAADGSYL